jgi:hypothetical protein
LRERIHDPLLVLNGGMTRVLRILPAVAVLALVSASAAQAKVYELGLVGDKKLGKPSCPENPCLAVTRTTGFQVSAGDARNLFIAPGSGRVVAFTLNLGKPSTTQIDFFNRQAGGTARARIAVLRPVPSQTAGTPRYLLNAQSTDVDLQQFFGSTVQFPLYTSLLVRKGYIIALSVPTWAPVLAVDNLANTFAWRASRVSPCSTNPERQPPHIVPGSARNYFCLYRPAQLTYSVTVVSAPTVSTTTQSPNTKSGGDNSGSNKGSGGGGSNNNNG